MPGFLRLLFVFLVFYLIRSLISFFTKKNLPQGKRPAQNTAPDRQAAVGRMVKDPVCGTYVATELAIAARIDSRTFHFCSRECKERFLQLAEARVGRTG